MVDECHLYRIRSLIYGNMICEVKHHVKIQRFGVWNARCIYPRSRKQEGSLVPQHELANRYRLVIPDLRGHGETEMNEGITVKNFALDIIELLEYLEIPSAFICGLSLGGIVAQELYKQRPDLVKGLILSNTTSYVPGYISE